MANVQLRARKRELQDQDSPDTSGTELDVMDAPKTKVGVAVRERQASDAHDSSAQAYLERIIQNDDDSRSSEESPLLGRDNHSDSGKGNNGETPWNGHADFEGLSWWRRPSVRYNHDIPCWFIKGHSKC